MHGPGLTPMKENRNLSYNLLFISVSYIVSSFLLGLLDRNLGGCNSREVLFKCIIQYLDEVFSYVCDR